MDTANVGTFLLSVLTRLIAADTMKIFTQPVDLEMVPDYADVVKTPMDFSKMQTKLQRGLYTIATFSIDLELIVSNCIAYNIPTSVYVKNSIRLHKLFKSLINNNHHDTGGTRTRAAPKKAVVYAEIEEVQAKPGVRQRVFINLILGQMV
jgi:hypothetical protein